MPSVASKSVIEAVVADWMSIEKSWLAPATVSISIRPVVDVASTPSVVTVRPAAPAAVAPNVELVLVTPDVSTVKSPPAAINAATSPIVRLPAAPVRPTSIRSFAALYTAESEPWPNRIWTVGPLPVEISAPSPSWF